MKINSGPSVGLAGWIGLAISLASSYAWAGAGRGGTSASSPAPAAPAVSSPAPAISAPALGVRSPALPPPTPGRSAALRAIMDEAFEAMLERSPGLGNQFGDERLNDRLPDETPAGYARWYAAQADRLARLKALDSAGLSEEDLLDRDLLIYELSLEQAGIPFRDEQLPVNAIHGPHVWLPQMPQSMPFLAPKHWADYASRLEQIPRLLEEMTSQMRAGMAAGRVQPKAAVTPAVVVAKNLAASGPDPTQTPFWRPFAGRAQDATSRRAHEAIASGVLPALARFAEFLENEYLPACRDSTGASQGVDGPALYDHALRVHTTTALTAEQIHAIGLREVARIRREMLGVIARTDWPGKSTPDDGDRLREFVQYLRTDPRFYHTEPAGLITQYRDIGKRIDAELPKLFNLLPRTPWGVEEIPRFAAPSQTTAYYLRGSLRSGRAGLFMANTFALEQRPKYEAVALTLHEAVPGHHLQIALMQEMTGTHPLRNVTGYTAFIEGWALYAERLGLEVGGPPAQPGMPPGGTGMYADPYDDFGRLTYEMWRAARLVVDTGLHAKGWPRQQAIDFMLANTALSPLNIQREVDRYIGWPGQACAYKIGELKIRELRARAEAALGDRFDLRAFHDTVLGAGSLPLRVLEARIDRWIAARKG